jgi:hypothetical protein
MLGLRTYRNPSTQAEETLKLRANMLGRRGTFRVALNPEEDNNNNGRVVGSMERQYQGTAELLFSRQYIIRVAPHGE